MSNDNLDTATQNISVYRASGFFVSDGVAQGDKITFADELVMDDIYQLTPGAERATLSMHKGADNKSFFIADGSPLGGAGNALHMDCAIMLISPDGITFEALVFVEVKDGDVADIFLLPLAPLTVKTDYRLVGLDRDTASARFAEVACVSFTRGTHITMASGAQIPIEDLKIGDRILTRDDGPQEIRWIGASTVRAVGAFAPVVIRKGTLNNENDLVVSPDHRVFIYQRNDAMGVGRSELLIKVRHLVNGATVFQQDGGFVDYFQLLFDTHQIIYAEGIAAESLLIDTRTRDALPAELAAELAEALPGHADRLHNEYEVQEDLLKSPNAAEILRRASRS